MSRNGSVNHMCGIGGGKQTTKWKKFIHYYVHDNNGVPIMQIYSDGNYFKVHHPQYESDPERYPEGIFGVRFNLCQICILIYACSREEYLKFMEFMELRRNDEGNK